MPVDPTPTSVPENRAVFASAQYPTPLPENSTQSPEAPVPSRREFRIGRRSLAPRTLTLVVSFLGVLVLGIATAFIPVPYAIERSGPTFDTLGKFDGKELIQITGAETFETTGQLRFVTVSVAGGPKYPVNIVEVVRAWLDSEEAVVPVEQIYPPGKSGEEVAEASQQQMTSSQQSATVAALEALGHEVPVELIVAGLSEDSAATGVIDKDDVLLAVNGVTLTKYSQLKEELSKIPGGTKIDLSVKRGDETKELTMATGTADDDSKSSLLGVMIRPNFDLPIDVKIGINDVGGPSAGLVFALGIMDKLTEEDEVQGRIIAGTGTIDVDGNVGAIGGIAQKMVGAANGQTNGKTDSDDKAEWFLAPADNCNEVVGNIPEGLKVVSVATLDEAWTAVKAIGDGKGDSLPTCSTK